jgi:hypothetical protein
MPYQAVFPAPFGPAPTGPYEYLLIPPQTGTIGNLPASKVVFFFLESFVGSLGAFADRLDLITGARIYRVLLQYVWRFPHDAESHFMKVSDKTFRFQVDDPSIGLFPVNEWAPAGL